ncbi:class I SAM-dependent methyltransferase [Streptomyces sp. NPDC087440]|uniref:class I SAM-dependent methyltransferase n=1 Tax=Streptomyces sp. NPDC087440 TaxID=3365790 RepID=UPI0037FC33F8
MGDTSGTKDTTGAAGAGGMYGADAAEIYEQTHRARGKDFAQEATDVLRLVGEDCGRRSLLDVACGTGNHLEFFAGHFEQVAGVDLSEAMLATARRRLPDGVPLGVADMRSFELDRTYQVITCLFASVGYLDTTDELAAALRCFGRHLAPGGVVAVEPWWFPATFLPGHVAADVVEWDGRTVSRVSHTVRDGDFSRMEVHYLSAEPGAGVRHFTETHRARLFTREEYEEAFRAAGFTPRYHPGVQSGRGLFTATAA